jgi:hypothetical protein
VMAADLYDAPEPADVRGFDRQPDGRPTSGPAP